MGKKKKQTQKKRQVKALKRRAQQKAVRKQRNVLKSRRKMPGIPGGMPPHMQQMAEQLMQFSMPIIEMAQPETPGQMNALAVITQGFWAAFQQQNLEKRAEMLEQTREAYESMPWAAVPFDELAENLLQRHIYLAPKAHSEEERSRYSEAELAAAMEVNFGEVESALEAGTEAEDTAAAVPGSIPIAESPDLSEIIPAGRPARREVPDLTDIVSEILPGSATEDESTAEPISATVLSPGEMDPEAALSLLEGAEREGFSALGAELKARHAEADFIDESDPVRQKLLDFQSRLVDIFEIYLQQKGVAEPVAAAHAQALRPFFDPFLKEYHQASIFTADAEQAEEYLLDFYVRKTARTPESDRYALNAFTLFFELAEKMECSEHGAEIVAQIEQLREEFEEFVRE